MTAKEYLQQNYKLDEDIRCLEQEEVRLRALAEGIKSTTIKDDTIKGGKRRDHTDFSDKYVDEICDKLRNKRLKFLRLNAEITQRILDVEDRDERAVLRLRYIEFKKWEEIEEELRFSNSKIHTIHPQALNNLTKKYDF